MIGTPTAVTVDIFSPAQQEGTKAALRTWFKSVGDLVVEGEPLIELETDKVALEVSAPASGRLSAILVERGDIEPGVCLGKIELADGQPEQRPPAPQETSTFPNSPSAPSQNASIAKFDSTLRLSPSVRRLLTESGLDPNGIIGTGRDGRLTRDDVQKEIDRQRKTPESSHSDLPAQGKSSPTSPVSKLKAQRIPHDSMRKRIAEHMAHSVATAPHVTAVFEMDLSAIMAHRQAHKAEFEKQGINLTYTAYFVQACVAAMKTAPMINSRWHEGFLEIFSTVNVGIGTALGDKGLIVPVIHDAGKLSLSGVASCLQDLTSRARAGKLTQEDVQNGTFTISNHGVSGSLLATPVIIHQPQSAILGIGKVEKRVIVREVGGVDTIQIRPMSYVSLTIDHRVVDGAQTNAWLTRFIETIEGWPEK